MWRSVWLAVSLALLAGARAEPSLYKRVASCIAQTTRQNVASITNRGVNIAQATSPEPLRTGEYYLASFSPGIGCMLFSVVAQPPPPDGMDQQDYQPYLPGPIVAVSSRAVGVSTDGFTCKFKKTDAVFTPAAVSYMSKNAQDPTAYQNNNTVPLYSLPNTLSSLAGKVRCSYMLFRKTGYSYTAIPRCDPSVDNCTIPGSIDIGSMQWQFDKDHKPKQSVVVGGTLVVTCGVNKALWNNNETILLAAPNGGACFPSWARVETPRGPKSMADLAVGEKVLAVNPTTGKAVYDDVYLVPHRDAEASTMFLNIHVAPVGADGSSPAGSAARVLTLSPLHYVPAACGAERQQQCLKHARDVATGDFVWLVEGQQAVLAQVKQVNPTIEQGLHSPWTKTGYIVVDGFVASTHTAWPGETQLLQLLPRSYSPAVQHLLAQLHHILQAPLRAVYDVFGKKPLAGLDGIIYRTMGAAKQDGTASTVLTDGLASAVAAVSFAA